MNNGYTPTEKRIINLLSDGRAHSREEIHELLEDELSPLSAINYHITNLRSKVKGRGLIILCVSVRRNLRYQLVRELSSPYDGRT